MEDNLQELCEDIVEALLILKKEELISEEELENHLYKKLIFLEELRGA